MNDNPYLAVDSLPLSEGICPLIPSFLMTVLPRTTKIVHNNFHFNLNAVLNFKSMLIAKEVDSDDILFEYSI